MVREESSLKKIPQALVFCAQTQETLDQMDQFCPTIAQTFILKIECVMDNFNQQDHCACPMKLSIAN
jgi:hypothetical protein